MPGEISKLHSRHLRRAWARVQSAIAGMTPEQMTWAPEGRWSAANLLEHLSLGFLITVKACGMVLRQESPGLPAPTWNQHWWAFKVITLGYLPMRVKAPKMVCPRGQSPEQALAALLEHLVEMDIRLQKCKEKFGTKVGLLTHPYLGPLTVSQWRKFQLFHVRRHMKQIRQLRKQMALASLGEPASPVRTSAA